MRWAARVRVRRECAERCGCDCNIVCAQPICVACRVVGLASHPRDEIAGSRHLRPIFGPTCDGERQGVSPISTIAAHILLSDAHALSRAKIPRHCVVPPSHHRSDRARLLHPPQTPTQSLPLHACCSMMSAPPPQNRLRHPHALRLRQCSTASAAIAPAAEHCRRRQQLHQRQGSSEPQPPITDAKVPTADGNYRQRRVANGGGARAPEACDEHEDGRDWRR